MATNNLNGSKGAYLELASSLLGLGTPIQVARPPGNLEKGAAHGVWESVRTHAMCTCFSLCCELVSRLDFSALSAMEFDADWRRFHWECSDRISNIMILLQVVFPTPGAHVKAGPDNAFG